MRFTFVHAADLHLDTPFAGIERVSPPVAAALRDASLEAFDGLVDLAIDRGAAFVLLAGDIYEGDRRSVRAQLRFLRGLERLAEQGIQAFIVHGNHDPLEGWSAIRTWPPGVTIFGSGSVEAVAVERGGARLATVYGISYGRREVTENLALRFRSGGGPGLHIGLLHCNAAGSGEHAPYSPCTVEELRGAGMDYWALGHIHRRQNLGEGDPWIVYPGNLQGRSPKPSERGAKGAVVVDVCDGAVERASPVDLDRVRFIALDIDMSVVGDLAEVSQRLEERARELRNETGGRSILFRASLTGRGAVARDLRRAGAIEDLLERLREEAGDDRPFLWWESIRDRTQPAIDREAIRRRGDFSSELIGLVDRLAGDPGRLDSFLDQHLKELPAAKLKRWLQEPSREETNEELQEAQALALELLEGEEGR